MSSDAVSRWPIYYQGIGKRGNDMLMRLDKRAPASDMFMRLDKKSTNYYNPAAMSYYDKKGTIPPLLPNYATG